MAVSVPQSVGKKKRFSGMQIDTNDRRDSETETEEFERNSGWRNGVLSPPRHSVLLSHPNEQPAALYVSYNREKKGYGREGNSGST